MKTLTITCLVVTTLCIIAIVVAGFVMWEVLKDFWNKF
jgi:hypothetical protein